MAVQQHGLGRGLSSLIPPRKDDGKESPFRDMVLKTLSTQGVSLDGSSVPAGPASPPALSSDANAVIDAPIGSIVPNPHQPRLQFDEEKLSQLSASIREHGILQPLVVTKRSEGKYELIAGERRLQAAKLAGLASVPVLVRDVKEQDKLELAIIENIQRHDLHAIEEAKAYARLMAEFHLTQEEVAQKMGKSRSSIANTLRLLSLPVEVQRALSEGKITEGHAKALLAVENGERQRALFDRIMKTGMTVREAEALAKEVSVRTHVRSLASLSPDILEKANRLSSALGTKVSVKPAGNGGKIVVDYYSLEEFENILKKISGEAE